MTKEKGLELAELFANRYVFSNISQYSAASNYVSGVIDHIREDLRFNSSSIVCETYDNGCYIGQKKDGRRHNYGCYIWLKGGIYEDIYFGWWKNGEKHGNGVMVNDSGYIEHSEYQDGSKVRTCYVRWMNGKEKYF